MKEDFLHHLWNCRKFDASALRTTNNEPISIQHYGHYLQRAGPDFFDARIIIGGQKWAGNVEIHLKSSDWYVHSHESDPAYENVILHVVWENDVAVFRKDNSEIPVLEIRHYTSPEILENYQRLFKPKSWIYCENELASTADFIWSNWLEKLFFERLERKSAIITELLRETGNDWEAVLFCLLAKNFGLNTNGTAFMEMARKIPFHVIRKESTDAENLESLFFGTLGLLNDEKEDLYFADLKKQYFLLWQKYGLDETVSVELQFFKHRPDNFPTIRLSQLAGVYVKQQNLFSSIIEAGNPEILYEIFKVSVSDYWKTHYMFDKSSPEKPKALTRSFIDLLVLNTIIPVQFAYAKERGKDIAEELISLMAALKPEANAILDKFSAIGISAKNAFESQSLLQLKNEYCNQSRCLQCAVGLSLLKA